MQEGSPPGESSRCSNMKSKPTNVPEPYVGTHPSDVDITIQVPPEPTSLEDEIPPSDIRAQVTSFVNDNLDEYLRMMWGPLREEASVDYDYDTSEETDTSSNGPGDQDPAFNQPISDDYVCYMSDSGESSTSSNSSSSSVPGTPSRTGSDTSGSTTSVSSSSSSRQGSGNGHTEKDDDDDWPAKRRRNGRTPLTIPDVYDDDSDVKYACHYHKYDPEGNSKCASFKTISLVNIMCVL